MRAGELREKSAEELELLAKDLDQELFNLRFQKAVGSQENPMRVRGVKKDLARVKTILRERQLAAQSEK